MFTLIVEFNWDFSNIQFLNLMLLITRLKTLNVLVKFDDWILNFSLNRVSTNSFSDNQQTRTLT